MEVLATHPKDVIPSQVFDKILLFVKEQCKPPEFSGLHAKYSKGIDQIRKIGG